MTNTEIQAQNIRMDEVMQNLKKLASRPKLSGETDADLAAEDIITALQAYGIQTETLRFPVAVSNPGACTLQITGEAYHARPRSYCGTCTQGCSAALVYDAQSKEGVNLLPIVQSEGGHPFAGKVVIAHGFDEFYAKTVESLGAKALIQIWQTPEEVTHEDTVNPIWGTPDIESAMYRLKMPVIGVSMKTGQQILKQMQDAPEPLVCEITVEMEEKVVEAVLPVADIPGKSDAFLMISGHYDTWYLGGYDNCSANAAAIELARMFKELESKLCCSVKFCFWPAHSNGRYAGSTWFADHYHKLLTDKCFAHINMDLIGAKQTDVFLYKSTGLEQDALLPQLQEIVGVPIVKKYIGRDADQSFFGNDIAYHFCMAFDADAERKAAGTSGPMTWWHTEADTFDKIDPQVLQKEIEAVAAVAEALVLTAEPPADLPARILDGAAYLKKLQSQADASFREGLDELIQIYELTAEKFEEASASGKLTKMMLQKAAGIVNRLEYAGGDAYHPDTTFAFGRFGKLAKSLEQKRDGLSSYQSLLLDTTFLRQKNRIIGELSDLLDALACTLR